MQTFFAPAENFTGQSVVLTGDDYFHATRSTRVRPKEIIAVTDGCGKRVIAEISFIDKNKLVANILNDVSLSGESSINVVVALSLILPARFETALEKCTEIGVKKFIPLITERTLYKPERFKPERLKKIVSESSKQSGRSFFPEIADEMDLESLCTEYKKRMESGDILILCASQKGKSGISEILRGAGNISGVILIIGPEGDFTDREISGMESAGVVFFNLGGLILRSETAAIVSSGIVLSSA